MDVWRAVVGVAYRFCFDLIAILFIAIGVLLASAGQVSIGSVVSALLYVGLLRQPLGELVGSRYPLIRAGMGLQRVEHVLASPIPACPASPRRRRLRQPRPVPSNWSSTGSAMPIRRASRWR